MSDYPYWAQALNISAEKWQEWCNAIPDHDSILFWGLTHEQISWSNYSQWSKGHYELCLLDDAYFQLEDTIGPELKSLLDSTLWKPWFQPLYNWDNVVYIACLEPFEAPVSTTKVFVPVICSPWQLETRWEKLSKLLSSTESPSELPELPDGIIMNGLVPPPYPETAAHTGLSVTKDAASIHLTQFNFEAQPTHASTETHDFGPISLSEAPPDINPSLKEREIISWLFNQIQPFFEMIWWVTLSDDKATVKWWYPAKKFDPSQLKIDTHTPSFFRIVKKTKLPYHGHIVDSVAHQTFFAAFGEGTLPAHVTALPVILQSEFKEMIIGSSNLKQQDPQMLAKVEKILEKALQALDSQREPTQKTA